MEPIRTTEAVNLSEKPLPNSTEESKMGGAHQHFTPSLLILPKVNPQTGLSITITKVTLGSMCCQCLLAKLD